MPWTGPGITQRMQAPGGRRRHDLRPARPHVRAEGGAIRWRPLRDLASSRTGGPVSPPARSSFAAGRSAPQVGRCSIGSPSASSSSPGWANVALSGSDDTRSRSRCSAWCAARVSHQMRPTRRERGSVQMTCQVAAQLDGLPVLPRRSSAGPAFQRPRRLRLILTWGFGLKPFLRPGGPVRLQLAADLQLERIILARPVRSADLFAHWHALAYVRPGCGSPRRWWPPPAWPVGSTGNARPGGNRARARGGAIPGELGLLRQPYNQIGD
jgi:hypothetical protein